MALITKIPISVNLLASKFSNCNRFHRAICVRRYQPVKQYSTGRFESTTQIKEDAEIDEFLNDAEYMHLKSEFIKPLSHDQRVLVVQPWVKNAVSDSTPDLMLAETTTLAESIPNWNVVYKFKKVLTGIRRHKVFGKKQLQDIADIAEQHQVNNVVVGLDWLNGAFQMKMEHALGRDVYDRYSMILRIFHSRATTKEAKIQTQLAEIPYIRSRLNLFSRNPDHHQAGMAQTIGTGGKDYYNRRKYLLDKRTKDLKQKLVKIENARTIVSPQRKSVKVPVVGIVGYTNCGKTSLIKYFAKNNQSIKPMDQLFATLDLSRFMIKLNNNQDVFLLDTIGFISNIPKNLLDAFQTTLKEICDCDLIIHIYDTNHPDLENQRRTVYQTLFDQIKLDEKLRSTMIEVGNKIDLIDEERFKEFANKNPEHLFVSITERINLPLLAERIQVALEKNLELIHRKFKVATGSDAYQFLVGSSTVKTQEPDKDNPNFIVLDVAISKKNYHHLMSMVKKKE